MNDKKLNHLFAAVRREKPPTAPEGFERRVMAEVRPGLAEPGIWAALQVHFALYAGTAVAIIVLCGVADFMLGQFHYPELADGVAQITANWLLPIEGI